MISGYGEMMRDLPGEKTDENIQVIIDESNRLTSLVNDLLDLSKMQANRITLQESDFSLSALVENQMKKYEVYRVQDGYRLETEIESSIMSVPPTRTAVLKPSLVESRERAACATCSASSLVGTRISACGRCFCGFSAMSCSTTGMRYAKVFPEPVGACARISFPCIASGMQRFWISESSEICRRASAFCVGAERLEIR